MGLFAPKSLPPQIAAKLNAALSEALDSADVRQKLDAFGAEIPSREERTQASFAEFVKREAQRWPSIVKAVRPTD
jgi:tripartite-type tricarboxylate transporter receptor subunit TctC